MDSAITQEYENPDNVADVSKQVAYSANTMDFSQDNFSTTNAPLASDGFHVQGDSYQIQQSSESVYNPVESVQHIQYENQGHHNLENIASQSYYSATETQYHSSYITEQSQDSGTVHRNNGISDIGTEQYIENNTTNSISEHYNANNTGAVGLNTINNLTEQPSQTGEDSSIKVEYGKTPSHDDTSDNQPIETSVESFEENQTTPDQENVIISTDNVNVKEEINLGEVVNNVEETNVENTTTAEEDTAKKTTVEATAMEATTMQATTVEEATVEETTVEETTVEETTVEKTTLEEITVEGEMVMVVQQVVEKTALVATESHTTQFTELQTYDAQADDYNTVEELSEEGTASQKDEGDEELMEVLEEQEEHQQANLENQVTVEKKPKRTRKPIFDVPMHLLGHDINKPLDPVPNGRALPKPRLGVKVPYRTLTSQIVSKAELEEVIIERSRAKEQASNKANVKFARSLTQRLANKIAPEKKERKLRKENTEEKGENRDKIQQIEIDDTFSEGTTNTAMVDDSKIQNDDDLLAILEGDGEEIPVLTKEISESQTDDSNLKLLEREIALQQLQELPLQEPKERIIKSRFSTRHPVLKPEVKTEVLPKAKSNSSNSNISTSKQAQKVSTQSSPKSNITPKSNPPPKNSDIDLDVPSPTKKQIEVEPQVKVNMVLKTYSRKRKTSDFTEFDMPSPKKHTLDVTDVCLEGSPKYDPLTIPTDVYVTKSSRIIKKKVIWDPDDEQMPRSSKAASSKVVESNKITPSKAVKLTPVSEKKPSEKTVERPKQEQKPVVKSPEKSIEKVSPKKVLNKKSPVIKPKKGLTEVDRLLRDEGAIKMLYDLKGEEAFGTKKKKDVYSVEKAEKEIIKKANLLKNDLVQNTSNESPKSLRKKEGPALISPSAKPTPILERKMSKDSTRSSVHTPPRSPTMFSSQSSMLIRRRSSSSISSDDMDQYPSKLAKSSKNKKQKKITAITEDKKDSKENEKSPTKDAVAKLVKGAQYKSFTMKKSGKHVSIDLNYIDDYCYFTIQVLEELISALHKLEKDKDCVVVSLTSTSKAFCLGLDYPSLASDESSERVNKATELAEAVREFLLCLLNFPKILVAGIQGECIGLGVTMLTLFDSVIASDTATFSTPYANLGCLGEATFLLSYANLSNSGLAAELLYANQMLKADEACRRGLISKLCWPEKYKDTLKNFLLSISKGSLQSLEMTKRQLRANLREEIEAAIEAEMDILIEHWTSSECQENFSKIEK